MTTKTNLFDPKKLRVERKWSQGRMAEYLGCDQATVSRIENGQQPSGPIKRLLEHLASEQPSEAA